MEGNQLFWSALAANGQVSYACREMNRFDQAGQPMGKISKGKAVEFLMTNDQVVRVALSNFVSRRENDFDANTIEEAEFPPLTRKERTHEDEGTINTSNIIKGYFPTFHKGRNYLDQNSFKT